MRFSTFFASSSVRRVTLFVLASLCGNGTAFRVFAQNTGPVLTPQVCTAPAPIDMAGAVPFGDGTPGSITQAALQALIDAGGKIVFNGGSSPVTLTLTTTLQVDARREVVIDGQGLLTISGNDAVRIFDKGAPANQAEGTLLGLQNMRLINGRVTQPDGTSDLGGAAIRGRFYGSLRLHNVAFENNRVEYANGVINNRDACGAVWTGGYREASFVNCTFTNNRGPNGGALGSIGSSVSIVNCVFEGNQATGTGGTFAQGGQGGAVYTDGVDLNGVNSYLSICGSVFRNSRAGHQAGALNASFYRNRGSTGTIDRCTFEDNRCDVDLGGAMYLQVSEGLPATGANGNFVITGCTFNNNRTPSQGGAAWVGDNTISSFTNCTFVNNRADNGTGGGLGGGLTFSGGTVNTVTNCTFSGNKAGNFAASIFNGGSTTLRNTLFYRELIGQGNQANQYAGGTINRNSSLVSAGGNLQFPATLVAQWGGPSQTETLTDFWITAAPAGSVLTTDAQLQALADNGGPTQTMALPTGSPAIDAGTAVGSPTADQRGGTRIGLPDIGAFEFGALVTLTPVLSASPAVLSGFSADADNPSAPQEYVLTGSSLGTGPVTATTTPPFQIRNSGGTFSENLVLVPAADGTLSQTVQVRMLGTGTGNVTGTVTHVLGGTALSILTLSGLVVALPVRLVRFSAQAAGDAVLLAWETASERNASRFLVQRSTDGETFETVGRVTALGDTRTGGIYGYKDETPGLGKIYYRLHILDRDDASEYSRVVTVLLDDATPAMALLGNPVADGVIRLAVRNLDGAVYSMYALGGSALALLPTRHLGGRHVELRPAGVLPAGCYLLVGQTGSWRQALRVVIK